jgi:hypothetical protein
MTVQDSGWAAMKNGALLREADSTFDVLVTADKNMHHQQNFAGLTVSVLVFPTNRAKLVRDGVPAIVQSPPRVGMGEKAIMELEYGSDWTTAHLFEVILKQSVSHHVFKARDHG